MGKLICLAALLFCPVIALAQQPKGQPLSGLPSATLPLSGSESLYLVQGGQDKKTPACGLVGTCQGAPFGPWLPLAAAGQTLMVTPGTGPLIVNGNTASPASFVPNSALEIVGSPGQVAAYTVDGFGAASQFGARRANGTVTAPTALMSGNNIVSITAFGYGATGYSANGRGDMSISAAENWTDTAQGTQIRFRVVPVGSVTVAEAMRIQNSGHLTIGSTTDGAGALQVTGGTSTDTASIGSGLLTLATGQLGISKIASVGSAPGASGGKLSLVCGTNSGTAKLVITAGTSATPVTIADNIGAGVSGC